MVIFNQKIAAAFFCSAKYKKRKDFDKMKNKRILSLILALVMIFSIIPFSVLAISESTEVSWKGAMNYNAANNYLTSTPSIPSPNRAEMKWAYPLNISAMEGGAYYAGQSVITDGYLYATGGGKLHKIDIRTGVGSIINENAGSTISYYDYLCYADGILILSTADSITAYSIDGTLLGSVSGSYGEYHPIQYYNGHIICNGFIYKVEKENESVNFTQIGDTTIGGDAFNWSSGAFVDDLFYVAAKTTIYAVDYKTNTIVDSYVFDPNRTAQKNVQGGLCYDANTGRLFWGTYTYNSYIHSIKIEGKRFVENSYISEDAGQKSVATPIVYNNRVYLAGQGGRICVHNADDLSKVYDYVTLGGGKVQGTPILSAAEGNIRIYAQCSNGHIYMFTDKGDSGEAIKLAETANYTKVLYPYAGFEQYAMDENGNIYCYNESGYLFCFGISGCEKPTITTNLSTQRVKYGVDAQTDALVVDATVLEGELSYQWQSGNDGENFENIYGATEATYTPSSDTIGTTYYRCVITNTVGSDTASEISNVANILIKNLSSNTTVNAMVGKTNSATATSNVAVATAKEDGILYVENCNFDVKNIFLGVADEGSVSSVEIIYGTGATTPKKYSVSNDIYTERYYKNSYSKPIVAKVSVIAEDGLSEDEKYLIVLDGESKKYITKATITSESDCFSGNTISFTEANQTAPLTIVAQETVGNGQIYNPQWKWSSSDNKVVTVDENGVIKCVGGGNAVITASFEGVTASVNIVSSAPEHTIHTYLEDNCSICGHKKPKEVEIKFSLIDKENKPAVSKDGTTQMYKTALSVGDYDCDGALTLKDAFWELHTQYSTNGASDFMTEESSYGPFITKLWGENNSNVAYMLNDATVYSLLTVLNKDDYIFAYFYRDTQNYSDIYTQIQGNSTITAGVVAEFNLKGICSSGNVVPKGATVEVFNQEGVKVSSTTVGEDGKFAIDIENTGEYVLKTGGNASYIGSAWDSATGGYKDKEFSEAPVVTSQLNITVIPYVEKTVYVTIASKNGEFAVNKNGDDMWNFPITVTDNPDAPDGVVTILETLKEAHRQYHSDGLSGFVIEESRYGAFITKLWGENNGGNCLYYFNNTEMTGMGIKTGTNAREWEDKLLDTVVETGDTFTIYSLQATDYKKSDLYTYFYPVLESATVGKEKTFKLNSVSGYGNNVVATSLVTVYDSQGKKIDKLSTTVNEDATFKITFTEEGTYTVDVRTNGANYISPARCIVNVKEESGSIVPADTITVYFTLLGDDKHGTPSGDSDTHTKKKGNLDTWISKTKITLDKDSCVADAIKKALSINGITYTKEDNYISKVNGLSAFDNGNMSGWMYMINGKYSTKGIDEQKLSDGDVIILHYTDDYTAENRISQDDTSSSTIKDKTDNEVNNTDEKEETQEEIPTTNKNTYKDVKPSDWYYEAVNYVTENALMNGTTAGFEPNANMTRAMLVTVLYRLNGNKKVSGENVFTDIKSGEWYYEAVLWAAKNGIVNGVEDALFAPNENITREQIAAVLYRYANLKGYNFAKLSELSDFEDTKNVSGFAVDAMKWANESGIISGTSKTTLRPKDTATRAQVATMLMRFCQNNLKI